LFIGNFCLQIDAEVAKLKELKAQLKEDETYAHDGSKKFVLKCPKVYVVTEVENTIYTVNQ